MDILLQAGFVDVHGLIGGALAALRAALLHHHVPTYSHIYIYGGKTKRLPC
eukprot:COSAG06_NODE_28790_length_568_cov_0.767591_1_plen_51_part_00